MDISDKKKERLSVLGVVLIAAGINLLLLKKYGVKFGGDSGFYLGNAQCIRQNGLSFYAENSAIPYYWGYPTFLALFNTTEKSALPAILAQIALAVLAVVLLYKIVLKISVNFAAALICSILYATQFEVLNWNEFILTDSLGMSVEVITLWLLYRIWTAPQLRAKDVVWFAISAVVFFTIRTNAGSLLFALIILLLAKIVKEKHISRLTLALSFAVIALAIILAFNIGSGTTYSPSFMLNWYKGQYESGIIVDGRDRLNYVVQGALGWDDVFKIILLRCKYYFSIFFAEYSLSHKLLSVFNLLPLWILSAISIFFVVREKKEEYYPVLFGALSYYVIQVLTSIDFDMRYRSPILCLLVILSSCAVKKALDAISSRKKVSEDIAT